LSGEEVPLLRWISDGSGVKLDVSTVLGSCLVPETHYFSPMLLVYRYRIKSLTDCSAASARLQFRLNFCNDTQQQALKWNSVGRAALISID